MVVKRKTSRKRASREARRKKKKKIRGKKAERIRTTRGMRMGPPDDMDIEHGGPKEGQGGGSEVY